MAVQYNDLVESIIELRSSVAVVTAATPLFATGTLGCQALFAGTYLVEFGAGSIDTISTGTTLQLVSDQGGAVTYSDTGPGGGIGIVTGAVLSALQTVTITCSKISGSSSASLIQAFVRLTRTA